MNATGLETTRFRAISEREQRSVPTCQENHHQWNAQLSPTKARRESGQVMTNVPSQDFLKRLAVEAWRQVEPERVEPESVEILKWSKKSMVYRLAGVGNAGTDVIAKRCCAATAKIERAIYEELLPRLPVPALRCYGAVQETAGKYAWLFLEEAGRRRYSPLSEDHRVLAGRWLGAVHGAALRTGFEAAAYERVAFTDADCQFHLADLASLLSLTERHPIAVGYRLDRKDPWPRRFFSWGYNLLVRAFLGTGVRDCDCALKVFRQGVLQKLLPETPGFFVNTEMLARGRLLDHDIAEVGVRHRPRVRGHSTVSLREVPRGAPACQALIRATCSTTARARASDNTDSR